MGKTDVTARRLQSFSVQFLYFIAFYFEMDYFYSLDLLTQLLHWRKKSDTRIIAPHFHIHVCCSRYKPVLCPVAVTLYIYMYMYTPLW